MASSASEQEVSIAVVGKYGAGEESLAKILAPTNTIKNTSSSSETCFVFTPIELREGRRRNSQALAGLRQVDVLVYCLSVDPDLKYKSANRSIMRSIQEVFGKDIWKQCILAFTFSNVIWNKILKRNKYNRSKAIVWYRKHLQKYADMFRMGLAELEVTANVKVVFNVDVAPTDLTTVTIPAIPVGEDLEDQVIPEVCRITQDAGRPVQDVHIEAWREVLLIEIHRIYRGKFPITFKASLSNSCFPT